MNKDLKLIYQNKATAELLRGIKLKTEFKPEVVKLSRKILETRALTKNE